MLQQKYSQANRHFIWSDEFCKLAETYSERIRADPANKYVHIRDIVSELKAYKAKPMKHVITSAHGIGLNNDYSSDSGSSLPTKRAKVELEDVKQELSGIKQEFTPSRVCGESSLPALLRSSSTLCKFVPLSAMSSSMESADVEVGECRLIDVVPDDMDSRSSFDDFGSSQPVTTVDIDEAANNKVEPALNSGNNSAVSCSRELLEPMKSSEELSADEVNELSSQTVSDGSEPTAHCSKQHDEHTSDGSEVKSKLPSARHISYLETLLSV